MDAAGPQRDAGDRLAAFIRDPDVAVSDCQRRGSSVDTDIGGGPFLGPGVDLADRPAAPVGDPEARAVQGQRGRTIAHEDRCVDEFRLRIDAHHGVVSAVGHPDAAGVPDHGDRVHPDLELVSRLSCTDVHAGDHPLPKATTHSSSPTRAIACGRCPTPCTVWVMRRSIGSIRISASASPSKAHRAFAAPTKAEGAPARPTALPRRPCPSTGPTDNAGSEVGSARRDGAADVVDDTAPVGRRGSDLRSAAGHGLVRLASCRSTC